MNSETKPGSRPSPKLSPDGERERAARRAREAEALRVNLLKRKAQARGRKDAAPNSESDGEPK